MHNLHLVVVHAETGEEACSIVDGDLLEYGSENNWRTMCGAVSEDNEVYDAKDGRFRPEEDDESHTIEGINKMVRGWITSDIKDEDELKKVVANGSDDTYDWWRVQKWAEAKYELAYLKIDPEKFDVLKNTYRCGSYDECGVTDNRTETKEEGEKAWVVFVDMHS